VTIGGHTDPWASYASSYAGGFTFWKLEVYDGSSSGLPNACQMLMAGQLDRQRLATTQDLKAWPFLGSSAWGRWQPDGTIALLRAGLQQLPNGQHTYVAQVQRIR
jgi:hypothetical protein